MRIIQSAWACNKPNLLTTNSGWLAPEYNLMSWTLSCLQLKQYYPELILYCDSVYAKMLIDTLQLPYNEVVCNLDALNKYHPELCALPKIHSYAQQKEPFLHVDGSVFIWEKFNENLLEGNLIVQNKEAATEYYEKIMVPLKCSLNYFPEEIKNGRKLKTPIKAYDTGIFGGNDIAFFKEYTSKTFEFVDKNALSLSTIKVSDFNIFFEQYFFSCLVKKHNKKVNILLSKAIDDKQDEGFDDFVRVPYQKKYLHLLGSNKRNDFICQQMASRLREDYPDYYYRIIEVFKKNKGPLFKDYYNLENIDKEQLVLRYNYLKNNYQKIERKECIKSLEFDFKKDLKKELVGFTLNKDQFIDFDIFNAKIELIVKKNFALISKDYLYARDCNSSFYFQYLFEDPTSIYKKKLVRDDNYEIISSKYNWSSFIEKQKNKKENEIIILEESKTGINTLVVPECDQDRFSVAYIDALDLVILEILKETKTVKQLFNELKEYFESEELDKSETEFENLIFGRIKLGLQMKSIMIKKELPI